MTHTLKAAAQHILAILDHPTRSVTALDADRLRDALALSAQAPAEPLATRELSDAEIWQLAVDCSVPFAHGRPIINFARALLGAKQ